MLVTQVSSLKHPFTVPLLILGSVLVWMRNYVDAQVRKCFIPTHKTTPRQLVTIAWYKWGPEAQRSYGFIELTNSQARLDPSNTRKEALLSLAAVPADRGPAVYC